MKKNILAENMRRFKTKNLNESPMMDRYPKAYKGNLVWGHTYEVYLVKPNLGKIKLNYIKPIKNEDVYEAEGKKAFLSKIKQFPREVLDKHRYKFKTGEKEIIGEWTEKIENETKRYKLAFKRV